MAASTADPWLRTNPLHVTASAVIVHPDSGRVLLRWHQRQQAWLQVGGHGDPGESDPLAVALREAREESGLTDLEPWPDAELRQVAIVPVPANSKEPAHEHADVRFIFATRDPDAARAESPGAPLRWLPAAGGRRRHLRGQPARHALPGGAPARLTGLAGWLARPGQLLAGLVRHLFLDLVPGEAAPLRHPRACQAPAAPAAFPAAGAGGPAGRDDDLQGRMGRGVRERVVASSIWPTERVGPSSRPGSGRWPPS